MALVNGGLYYLLTPAQYAILQADGEYDSYLACFSTEPVDGYYFAPKGSLDLAELNQMILLDTTVNGSSYSLDDLHMITLTAGTYWSGYGFTQTGF